jgi:hypothetical protein
MSNTYKSAREAAKVWAAKNGVVTRPGTYFNAISAEAYGALPEAVRYTRRDREFILTRVSTTRGYKASAKIRGWDDLVYVLVEAGILISVPPQPHDRQFGRTRYALTTEQVQA